MSRQTLKKRAKNLRIVVNNGKRHYKPIKYPTNIPLKNTDIYFLTTFGDRLDLLAKSIYKDERLWWIIAIANPDTVRRDSLSLKAGIELRVPTQVGLLKKIFEKLNS